MGKGSNFEREVCTTLSLWWTGGKSDSEFWRTAMSGGRATVRGRQGKSTTGHAGDICATGRKGLSLTNRITFELKRGYNRTANVHNLLDLRERVDAQQEYEKWVYQATEAAARAKTEFWAILHRRDGRAATIMIPMRLWKKFEADGAGWPVPVLTLSFRCRRGKVGRMKSRPRAVVMMTLAEFLECVRPEMVRGL